MKSKTTMTQNTTLELSESEAAWLRALMQNPIGCTPEEETQTDRRMRTMFWEALAPVVNL